VLAGDGGVSAAGGCVTGGAGFCGGSAGLCEVFLWHLRCLRWDLAQWRRCFSLCRALAVLPVPLCVVPVELPASERLVLTMTSTTVRAEITRNW
jgi:hypothetical protein